MRNDKNRREERIHSSGASRAGPNALACLHLMTGKRREKEGKHATGYTVDPGPWHPMLIERQNVSSNLDIFNTPAHQLSLPKVHNKFSFFYLLRAEWWGTDSFLQPYLYSVQSLHFIKMLGHFLQNFLKASSSERPIRPAVGEGACNKVSTEHLSHSKAAFAVPFPQLAR